MFFSIDHETRLDFSQPVYEHHCEIRLTPRVDPHMKVLRTSFDIDPPAELTRYQDAFGNIVQAFDIINPHSHLVTRLKSEVSTTLANPFNYAVIAVEREAAWYRKRLKEDPFLWQFLLHRSAVVPEWSSLDLSGVPEPPTRKPEEPVPEALKRALDWAAGAIRYQPGSSHTHSTLQEALTRRQGVCQDFAHLLLALVRSWKIPVRYVMGYMNARVENYEGSNEATHAWVEVLVPGAGWRGYDATNRLCANDLYIPIAVGRDYLDAAPQRGTFKGVGVEQKQTLRVTLTPQSQQQAQAQAAQQ